MNKPRLSFWQIWNMSFGFLGIQFGWGLQMANMSPIYERLGASEADIPLLWLAAPITGLFVQPIIGYLSDRTWTGLGRRRPYFLIGALLSSVALILMPNSPGVWMAAGLLWILDASINISMEPFRAFVADKLPEDQRTLGFSIQSLFIGLGQFIAAALPWVMTNLFDVENVAAAGKIPLNVKLSFYMGAAAFLGAVLWTIFTSKEYPPEDMEEFNKMKAESAGFSDGLKEIFSSIGQMPRTMRQLASVQFFTWVAMFCMWIYFTISISRSVFGYEKFPIEYEWITDKINEVGAPELRSTPEKFLDEEQMRRINENYGSFDNLVVKMKTEVSSGVRRFTEVIMTNREKYSAAQDWGGWCFAFYSLVTFFFSFLLAPMARKFSRKTTHTICLICGGLGLISVFFVSNQYFLLLSMAGVGIAWASILSMPYAMLAGSLPVNKYGIYMGIFNFFIVIPQIVAALLSKFLMPGLLNNNSLIVVAFGGVFMLIAGLLTLRVDDIAAVKTGE